MPLLTVFTPTYNRSDTLKRTYYSLCRQTSKNFIWLIIDDGSTDNTAEMVKKWISATNSFEIKYFYKENGGLHTGYNKAIEQADTELMVCIDSDDYMPDNAVEIICDTWIKYGSDKFGGIVGLDFLTNGNLVGNLWPDQQSINLIDVCVGKIDVHGDKKQVVRTDLFKQVAPMPSFSGEKNFNPYFMILKIALTHDFIIINENLCYVDYQENGMTANQWKQYMNSPNSFAEIRKLYLSLPNSSIKYKAKQAIHYIASCLIAKKKKWLKESPKKLITVLMLPLGFLMKYYIIYKSR